MKKIVATVIILFVFVALSAAQRYDKKDSKKVNSMSQNKEKATVRIDIIADLVCPWCYIGYHRLEKALELVDDKLQVDIHWHPYILNSHYPKEGVNYKQHLIKKYGRTAEEVDQVRAAHTEMGEELGIKFSYSEDMRTYNSIKGHQLVRLAREYGKEAEMKVRLMTAFFGEQKDISDIPTLLKEAKTVGLDVERSKQVLENDEYAEAVLNEIKELEHIGVNGVPTYIINQKYTISGAQDPEYFAKELLKIVEEK